MHYFEINSNKKEFFMVRRFSIFTIILFVLSSVSVFAVIGDSITIKRDGKSEASVSNPYGSLWEYSENGNTWSVNNSDNGKVVFKKDYDTLAEGKFRGSKLEMKSINGNLYLKLKITAEKIKINWNTGDDTWSLKRKESKIKAKYNDMDYGKIKYYPDNGKLKVKDRFDTVVAEIDKFDRLCFAPGAFLMTDLSNDQKIFLSLLLFSKKQ